MNTNPDTSAPKSGHTIAHTLAHWLLGNYCSRYSNNHWLLSCSKSFLALVLTCLICDRSASEAG
jgi:hypothetical protein